MFEDHMIIQELPITKADFPYWYRGKVVRVVDGDTYVIDIDLGLHAWQKNVYCRGYGYDTWETRRRPSDISDKQWEEHKKKGKTATEYVRKVIGPGTEVVLNTVLDREGKYGRVLARIYAPVADGYFDLKEALKYHGHLKNKSTAV